MQTEIEFTTHYETISVKVEDIDFIEHNENDYPLLHLKKAHPITGTKDIYLEFLPKEARPYLRN